MTICEILPTAIKQASERISGYTNKTPLLSSSLLNRLLGHEIYFKCENLQKVGAFKFRGAINTLLTLKEQNKLPKRIVAFSSGNHAQAIAHASSKLGIASTIFMPSFTSKVKQAATKAYGADLVIVETRKEAEEKSAALVADGDVYLIPPFDHDSVIIGQGTACYEALQELKEPDAVFASVGGGGLLSGTYLAKELLSPKTEVFGAEPKQANDAALSLREGKIFSFDTTPETIADGVRPPAICERTFHYLKKTNGIIEVEEENIIYWTQWLTHLLKLTVEPTSALPMAAAAQWLKEKQRKRIIIILSGGNIDFDTRQKIWQKDFLNNPPSL